MPDPIDNPQARDPALSQRHAAGHSPATASPAERALAPEADAPLQSPNAIADDGTYIGQGGGYVGAAAPAAESGTAHVEAGSERGDGTYGYPAGPEVGIPGGEHRPGRNGRR